MTKAEEFGNVFAEQFYLGLQRLAGDQGHIGFLSDRKFGRDWFDEVVYWISTNMKPEEVYDHEELLKAVERAK